jgi:glyoxylase-like metal-dependent hydrolase (beta-lactamase superfamily II)
VPHFVCVTCGCQYAETVREPDGCKICLDERQYVGVGGQRWTTLEELRAEHYSAVEEMEPGLTRIGMRPSFGIGQHCYLVESSGGNVLWDCITLVDEATVAAANARGGISAIALSHPHYYSSIVEWSRAFDGAPIYIHEADREWVTRPDSAIVFWEGEKLCLGTGLTLIRGGGHFEGGSMLHWEGTSDSKGALLAGDIIQVVHDARWVSFMYSYANLIPLPPAKVRRLIESVEPYDFERIYSPWLNRIVQSGGKEVVRRSAERYIAAIRGSSGEGEG